MRVLRSGFDLLFINISGVKNAPVLPSSNYINPPAGMAKKKAQKIIFRAKDCKEASQLT